MLIINTLDNNLAIVNFYVLNDNTKTHKIQYRDRERNYQNHNSSWKLKFFSLKLREKKDKNDQGMVGVLMG